MHAASNASDATENGRMLVLFLVTIALYVVSQRFILFATTTAPDTIAAIGLSNAERAKAERLGIRQVSYPEFLGELTKEYKTICVSGTNGKSTTTAILGILASRRFVTARATK